MLIPENTSFLFRSRTITMMEIQRMRNLLKKKSVVRNLTWKLAKIRKLSQRCEWLYFV